MLLSRLAIREILKPLLNVEGDDISGVVNGLHFLLSKVTAELETQLVGRKYKNPVLEGIYEILNDIVRELDRVRVVLRERISNGREEGC